MNTTNIFYRTLGLSQKEKERISYKRLLFAGVWLVLRSSLLEGRKRLAARDDRVDRGVRAQIHVQAARVKDLRHQADVCQGGGEGARGKAVGVDRSVLGNQRLDRSKPSCDHLLAEGLHIAGLSACSDQLHGLHLALDRYTLQGLDSTVDNFRNLHQGEKCIIKTLRMCETGKEG